MMKKRNKEQETVVTPVNFSYKVGDNIDDVDTMLSNTGYDETLFDRDEDILIDVHDVAMRYRMPSERIDNIKEYFIKLIKGKLKYTTFDALHDINLQVRRGESLALIGRNGAGKSTLLRIIAGIIEPTNGYVRTRGNMVPLLKLGAGFDYNATGKENVFLNGAMLGFSHKAMQKKYDSIVEFAELEKFMNVPLKNYSAGMLSRLGFAIAVDVQPDVLLIDEVLAVGDAPFQQKCAAKIDELRANGTTFIVVSHSMAQVNRLCQRAVYIQGGTITQSGTAKEILKIYDMDCKAIVKQNAEKAAAIKAATEQSNAENANENSAAEKPSAESNAQKPEAEVKPENEVKSESGVKPENEVKPESEVKSEGEVKAESKTE